jgi:hypothetical protein
MPVTVEEVKKILRHEFPGSDVGGITEKDHEVVGTIIWKGFKGKDPEARGQLLLDRVLDKLGMRGINIGFLYPLAPGEKP